MKEQVAEHVQALCQRDPTFARRTMLPGKSMVLCFQYLTKKAFEYVQDEMKANGIEPGPGQEGYGIYSLAAPEDGTHEATRSRYNINMILQQSLL